MPRINVLDTSICNRIAAGEVISGPSAVVKELVENSVDALATSIVVRIYEGGIRKITVTDDGAGIYPDELKTAFLPHATSKISKMSDLDTISTMGFRGEALPSIASVSKVTVISKPYDVDYASQLVVDCGKSGEVTPAALSDGTDITVENLFYNTPARRKFLKQPKSEQSDVTSIISKLIISNPFIRFKYFADDSLIYESKGDSLESAIEAVYGHNFCENLLKVGFVGEGMRIDGYIGKPILTKPNRNYQVLMVNDRYVKDYSVSTVVQRAYEDRLMKGCFPVYILNISLPFDEVDVSIHPAKAEVKFLNGRVFSYLFRAVNNTLNANEQIPLIQTTESVKVDIGADPLLITTDDPKQEMLNRINADPEKYGATMSARVLSAINSNYQNENKIHAKTNVSESSESFSSLLKDMISSNNANDFETVTNDTDEEKRAKREKESEDFFSTTDRVLMKKILGQAFNTYIFIELENKLYVIDQHAAHERILFDDLVTQVNKQTIAKQDLLVPFVKTYSDADYRIINEVLDDFQLLGFDIDEPKKNTIRICSIPYVLNGIDIDKFVDSFLKENENVNVKNDIDYINKSLATAACRAAVKAGDKLNEQEINNILYSILKNNTPLRCPHGRPIVVCITKPEIEKWFKRIV